MTSVLQWVEYSFASPLKQIAEIFDFEQEEIYGTQEQKLRPNTFWNVSGREFLQKFGTEICRNTLPKHIPQMDRIWIKLMQKKIKNDPSRGIVVSDCRFPDEAELCKFFEGHIIKITRDDEKQQSPESHHVSENYNAIPHDILIMNDSTIGELENKLLTSIIQIILNDKKYKNHINNTEIMILEKFCRKAN
jgi:hypothetical protein